MMASAISSTEERIALLLNNAILPTDDYNGCLALFDKYFFKNNEFLESERGHAEEHHFNIALNKKIK